MTTVQLHPVRADVSVIRLHSKGANRRKTYRDRTDINEPSVSLNILLPFDPLKGLVQEIPDVHVAFKRIQQRPVKAFGK